MPIRAGTKVQPTTRSTGYIGRSGEVVVEHRKFNGEFALHGSWALPQKYESHLDRVSTGSGSDLVKPRESKIVTKYHMLITDQVATAPCTDPIQE